MITISKTRSSAENISKKASYLEFDNTGFSLTDIGGKMPIGYATPDQLSLGVDYPNIQSAISDVYTLCYVPVGRVLISDVDESVAGVKQVTRLYIEGSTVTPDLSNPNDLYIELYGSRILMEIGDNKNTVANKLYTHFSNLVNNGLVFDYVDKKEENDEVWLEFRFIDCLPHKIQTLSQLGMRLREVLDVPNKIGFGEWLRLGSEEKFEHTLYYYKRIG